jgi:hypothetical protein
MEKIQIRDPGWKKIQIRDKHPGSATLSLSWPYFSLIKRYMNPFRLQSRRVPRGGGNTKLNTSE